MNRAVEFVSVKLTSIAGGKLYVGRKKSKNKPKISSVIEFNRKMIFIRKSLKAGCPFAPIAIIKVERSIELLTQVMRTRIKVLSNKRYSDIVEEKAAALTLEYKTVLIQTTHYDDTAMKLMTALVTYDELNHILMLDTFKCTGRLRVTQPESVKIRRKFRKCIESVFEYTDVGIRGRMVGNKVKENDGYKRMIRLYGEPEYSEGKQTRVMADG